MVLAPRPMVLLYLCCTFVAVQCGATDEWRRTETKWRRAIKKSKMPPNSFDVNFKGAEGMDETFRVNEGAPRSNICPIV